MITAVSAIFMSASAERAIGPMAVHIFFGQLAACLPPVDATVMKQHFSRPPQPVFQRTMLRPWHTVHILVPFGFSCVLVVPEVPLARF